MSGALVPHLPAYAREALTQFLARHAVGTKGVVVGLSGGIDSAVVARLAKDALGPERVLTVLLPDEGPSRRLVEESEGYARVLGVRSRLVPIQGIVDAARAALAPFDDPTGLGNLSARVRMMVLYGIARETGCLVAGTGNKSELLLGYFTKHGDGGVDLLPIGDLYKTEVFELAETLGLPEAVRRRVPTAGFWEGQTDEGELGLEYRSLDRILKGIEALRSDGEIVALTGLPEAAVRTVRARVLAFRHKRRLPPIPKLGLRTVGIDWRD
ncbi:MAG TPA: NAD+ synthase [Thermoplasmata archaeon]|nr:NAD+ synthase [Thermoplasmata archaeon]